MVRICVTGCAGFIGSHVSACALDHGTAVTGIDSINSDYDVRLKEWRLRQLMERPGFLFHQFDLTKRTGAQQLIARDAETVGPISAVIHLAGCVGLRRSLENPSACYDANVSGTESVLEICRQVGIPRFVLASTAAVYGQLGSAKEDGVRPVVGNTASLGAASSADSPYAESKRAAEQLVQRYHSTQGIAATIARLFTVYGPAGHPEMSVFRFIRAMHENRPVVIYGDGTQLRDFTYVSDVARALIEASRLSGFDVLDVGTGEAIPLLTVVDSLREIIGSGPTVRHLPAHLAEAPDRAANARLTEKVLGWASATPLHEGLKRCVDWYRENREWVMDLG